MMPNRLLALATANLLFFMLAAGCSSGDSCQPSSQEFCEEGAVYTVDTCGKLGEVIEECDCGCQADHTACEDCQVDDPCLPDPCNGHGTCINNSGAAVCVCDLPFFGPHCEQDDCEDRQCGPSPNLSFFCGTCPGATEYCDTLGHCVDDCAGRECGRSPERDFYCGTCSGLTPYCDEQNGDCLIGMDRWVVLGVDGLAYSDDGIDWTSINDFPFVAGRSVAWNGTMWVAVGYNPSTSPPIAYSYDGIHWTGLGADIFGDAETGHAIAWNGNMWVAAGEGTNTLAYSYDGINWTGLGDSVFTRVGRDVAWDGNMWVATGGGTNSFAYSEDGIHWTGSGFSVFGSLDQIGLAIASNDTMWVATGGAGTNTLAYSYDGINWTGAGNSIFEFGYDVAWNGNMWVAVGRGANSIAYSYDGIDWTGLGTTVFGPDFTAYGHGIAWNGNMWVAVGEGTNSIAYSVDGINWIGLGIVLGGNFQGIASAPGPELIPPVSGMPY